MTTWNFTSTYRPDMQDAPAAATFFCTYQDTPNGDFNALYTQHLIATTREQALQFAGNVWLAGETHEENLLRAPRVAIVLMA